MAGKPKFMSQIKQLLRLHQQGNSKKFIARSLRMSRNTVKSYLLKLEAGGWDIEALLVLEDASLEHLFLVGNPAYKEDRYDVFKNKFEYFIAELKRKGVTKHLLWQEYRQSDQSGEAYSYSQFCFHLMQHQKVLNPSMVLTHIAGEKLFIDFAGKTMDYIDPVSGEVIACQIFVACLPYSGYSYVCALRSQSVEDFIYALSCCLEMLGGVVELLVPDNLKSAIIKADRYEPEVNQALDDFANHYGCAVFPARVRKPKDKALVENQVRLTYTHIFARLRNVQFFSLQALNAAIAEKSKLFNQTRMQQKPYSREEKFLLEEKQLLKQLPQQRFQIKYYKTYTVAKNNHIYLTQDGHHYSVPYVHIGQKVKVIYTRSLVKIYHDTILIASHARDYLKGKYTTDKEHLCSHHRFYLDRSPQYYIGQAKKKSAELYDLFVLIFAQDKHPEQLYRTCDGILRVAAKSDLVTLEKVCALAIEHQNYTYSFMKNILANNMAAHQGEPVEKTLPKHENIRGKNYYS